MPELLQIPPSWRLENRAQVVDLASAVRDGVLGGDGGGGGGGGGGGLPAGEKLDLREMIEEIGSVSEEEIPAVFICPISLQPMMDPVTLCTGQTYERSNIQKWFSLGRRTCPTTMQELWDDAVTPNRTLRQLIHAWFSQRRHRRRKRAEDVHGRTSELVESLKKAKKKRVRAQVLKELYNLVVAHAAARKAAGDGVAVAVFLALLGPFTPHAVGSLAVAVLSLLPLDFESRKSLLQPAKMSLVADMINEGAIETKICCCRLIETLISPQQEEAIVSCLSLSLFVGLLKMVKDKRFPEGISSALRLLRSICKLSSQIKPAIISIGAIPQIVDRIPDLKQECTEFAFEILASLSEIEEGCASLRNCPGTIKSSVRALMAVSESCTGNALAVLSAVCRSSPAESGLQAVEAGLAAKLLLVIQSGCSPPLKQRSAELLKLCSLNYTADMFISKCRLTSTIH